MDIEKMKEIKLKDGAIIYIDEFNIDNERCEIYDSNKRYIDYLFDYGAGDTEKELKERNIKVPEITVFDDDFDDISDLLGVPFKSIRQDGFKLGQIATEMLYKKITGKETEDKIYI